MATQVIRFENWVQGTLNDITVFNPAQNIVYTEKDATDSTLWLGLSGYSEPRIEIAFPSVFDMNVFHTTLVQTIAVGTAGTGGTAALIGSNITRAGTVPTTTTTTRRATTTTTTLVPPTTTTTTLAPPRITWSWTKDAGVAASFRIWANGVAIVNATETTVNTIGIQIVAGQEYYAEILSGLSATNDLTLTVNSDTQFEELGVPGRVSTTTVPERAAALGEVINFLAKSISS